MKAQHIFLDDLGNIRAGWRIGLFFILLVASVAIIFSTAGFISSALLSAALLLFFLCILLATFVMVKIFEKRPLKSVGIPLHSRMPVELFHGIVIGCVMMTVIFTVSYLAGWVEISGWNADTFPLISAMVYSLSIFLVAGMSEEFIFRGYPFQTLIESIGPTLAVVIMSIGFSITHAFNPHITPLAFFNIFLAGIWLSLAYLKTRTLWFPAALHISWNFFQHSIYSFPVSGQQLDTTSLLSVSVTGPEMWMGGDFGPEGGLLTTLVLLSGILYIHYSPKIKVGEGVWTVEGYIREELEKFKDRV